MKHLRTYESFSINEELMDMMTMPVDPIKGAAQVYGDLWDDVKSQFKVNINVVEEKIDEWVEKYVLPKVDVENLISKISSFVGGDITKMSMEDMVMKFKDKLGKKLSTTFEALDDDDILARPTKDDNLVDYVMKILTIVGFVNISSGGSALALLLTLFGLSVGAIKGFFIAIAIMIVIFIIRSVINKYRQSKSMA